MAVLVTGVAGFIGMHVAAALLKRGERVVGVDDMNAYYPAALKEARLATLIPERGFTVHRFDLAEREALLKLVRQQPDIDAVVHLAAQAGVRYSLQNPRAYVAANLVGQIEVTLGDGVETRFGTQNSEPRRPDVRRHKEAARPGAEGDLEQVTGVQAEYRAPVRSQVPRLGECRGNLPRHLERGRVEEMMNFSGHTVS